MNLAKTITRMFPTENLVGFTLILTDSDRPDLGTGAQVVVSKTFKVNIPDSGMTTKAQQELGREAQAEIDKYKKLINRYNNPVYQTKVEQIDNALTL